MSVTCRDLHVEHGTGSVILEFLDVRWAYPPAKLADALPPPPSQVRPMARPRGNGPPAKSLQVCLGPDPNQHSRCSPTIWTICPISYDGQTNNQLSTLHRRSLRSGIGCLSVGSRSWLPFVIGAEASAPIGCRLEDVHGVQRGGIAGIWDRCLTRQDFRLHHYGHSVHIMGIGC